MRGPHARHRDRRRLACVAAAVLLSACGSGTVESAAPSPTPAAPATLPPGFEAATDIDPALLGPLVGLGPCEVEPNTIDDAPADGLVLPPGAVLTEQAAEGPLTSVKGYVPMTPVQVRVWYELQPGLEIVQSEDEVRESESLVDNGEHRLFVKAQGICESGSVFLAVLAPKAADAQLPAPAGTGGTGTP